MHRAKSKKKRNAVHVELVGLRSGRLCAEVAFDDRRPFEVIHWRGPVVRRRGDPCSSTGPHLEPGQALPGQGHHLLEDGSWHRGRSPVAWSTSSLRSLFSQPLWTFHLRRSDHESVR